MATLEKHCSGLLECVGVVRGYCCGEIFYDQGRDIAVSVHGGDSAICGLEDALWRIQDFMKSWSREDYIGCVLRMINTI